MLAVAGGSEKEVKSVGVIVRHNVSEEMHIMIVSGMVSTHDGKAGFF